MTSFTKRFSLVESENVLDITLTIKLKGVSVDLNVSESLIVINTLAVKRAELRGGLWSTAGKSVEKFLLTTLCKIFEVPLECYDQKLLPKSFREVDFYLIDKKSNKYYRCEVKLMGRGNPESADAVIARDSNVFIADKLSDLKKKQLDKLKIEWVELRAKEGYKRFATVLVNLKIPFKKFDKDIDEKLKTIFEEIF